MMDEIVLCIVRPGVQRIVRSAALVLCSVLAGCATYSARPLPQTATWREGTAGLSVDARDIALPALAAQRIDLREPLTMPAVAALAVLNDPSLTAARDRAGVARAEAFAAGLLPTPEFTAERDIPQGHSSDATTSGYNLGVSLSLRQFITHGASVSAARGHASQIDLEILWQEWQTASAAELGYLSAVGLRERARLLAAERDAVAERLARERVAAATGIATRTAADADLVELTTLQRKLADDANRREAALASLDALLGLRPGTELRLADLPRFDPDAVRRAAATVDALPRIRPDLMALRAGYASQEATLRKAVLTQFPSIGVSLSRARDTSDVHTLGFGITFSLPIFNGSAGRIAVARATRAELYDAYRLRLQQAQADVARILVELSVLRHEHATLNASLPALRDAAKAADAALRTGDITLPQAQAQRIALLDQQLALQANAQQIAERTAALQLLTGSGIFSTAKQR